MAAGEPGICFLLVEQLSQDQQQHCCTMSWLARGTAAYREGSLSGAGNSGSLRRGGWVVEQVWLVQRKGLRQQMQSET
jgi:hypothetical protein